MSFYEVKAKCGHVGRKFYALKTFAIKAENGREAARIARDIPRVKHHHKDAIVDVKKIEYDRYIEIIEMNQDDPYFKCHNVQEQRDYIDNDIYPEVFRVRQHKDGCSIKKIHKGKTLVKKPKTYIRNYYLEEGWCIVNENC